MKNRNLTTLFLITTVVAAGYAYNQKLKADNLEKQIVELEKSISIIKEESQKKFEQIQIQSDIQEVMKEKEKR